MIAFVILVFVESQDVATPLPAALVQAAYEALGPRATVLVRPVDRETAAQALVGVGRQEGALAVARVSWAGGARLNGRVEVIVVETGRTQAQALAFEDSDPLPERGRALGLVLAALVRPEATSAPGDRAVPRPSEAVASVAPPPPPASPPRWALDAAVEGGFALGGAGSGAGGTVGFRWLPFRRVSFRLGARARFGQVGEAQATLLTLAGVAGVGVSVLEPRDGRRLGLGVRADALLLHESLSHLSSDDPESVRQGRMIPGASLLAEVRWSLSPVVSLLLAAGPEVAFGTTQVFVRQSQVAELAPFRAVIQGGLLATF